MTDVDAEAARTYVLDTSVLLSDPRALMRFDEHDVVIPIAVLIELEAKRHHPDLGWAAREALRTLERLRVEHGSLTEPILATEHGGTIRVELNHQDRSTLPAGLRSDDNDHRILTVAHNLAADGRQVTVVTKDLPLRLKASIAGLDADEYLNEQVDHEDWTGYVELAVDQAVVDELFEERVVDLDEARDLPCNTGVALTSGSQSGLGRVRADKRVHLVRGDRALFDVRGRSAEQRVALDLLADPEVGIVSLGGRAGTGKSVLALAAGLEAVLEQRGAEAGGHLPAPVRGGRPGPRLPPGRSRREDGALGRSGARRARRDRRARPSSKRCWPASCSRSCRSPTSGAATSATRS